MRKQFHIDRFPDESAVESSWEEIAPGRLVRTLSYSNGLVILECDSSCGDCGKFEAETFYVTHPLWDQYGNGHGFLCFQCFEKRLGRSLTAADLCRDFVNELTLQVAGVPLNPNDDVIRMMLPRRGQWSVSCKSDPRWDGQGESPAIGYCEGMPVEAVEHVENKKQQLLAEPPEDCTWGYHKDPLEPIMLEETENNSLS